MDKLSSFKNTSAFAESLDNIDPLKEYRNKFHFPKINNDKDALYFNGNSLGLQPKITKNYIQKELDEWALYAGEGHFKGNTPWVPYHELLTPALARLVGANENEVITMNSLTVNLHLLMVSFYKPTKSKYKVLLEYSPFPSDRYAIQSHTKFHGFEDAIIELNPSHQEIVSDADIIKVLEEEGDEIALILIGGVNYYSGQVYDMKKIVKLGKKKRCIVAFDLAHAVGNIKLELHDWNVDFAVWCSYKYLNSGPGSVGGAFIHDKYLKQDLDRFAGWWGHDKDRRFLMEANFNPIKTAEGWQISNPPILSLAAIFASLTIFDEVGMNKLIKKSKLLTSYMSYLIELLPKDKIKIITPKDRGCQLSLVIEKNGKEVHDLLTSEGVFSDWREPNVIRIAPVPLYNSFTDVFRFYELLKKYLK